MAKLIKIEEDGVFLGFAIRELRSIFGYEYLDKDMNEKLWWGEFKYSHYFLFQTEEAALNRWENYKKMLVKKRKITVIRTLK